MRAVAALRVVASVVVTGWLTTSLGWAQTTALRIEDARVLADIRHAPTPQPLTDAARAAVTAADPERTAAAPTTPTAQRHGCAKKVVLGALYGAGAGAVYVVVQSDGSESAVPMIKAFAGLGAIVGALGGAFLCAL